MKKIETDTLVIGGGIFGAHAAKILASYGSVILVEKNAEIISEASRYNQTRVHTGAHYPRAPHTASTANRNLNRFHEDYAECIYKNFDHYYAIAKNNSLTDKNSFERFLGWLEIPYEIAVPSELEGSERISASYSLQEFSFDPYLLRVKYEKQLIVAGVRVILKAEVVEGTLNEQTYKTKVMVEGELMEIYSKRVVNATYGNLNIVNNFYGADKLNLRFEKARLLFLSIPSMKNKAITIMDGPFLSLTPYGMSGLHVLTSVIYTHQKIKNELPEISSIDSETYNKVNDKLMLNQLKTYIPNLNKFYLQASETVIKATLETDDEKDERPTVVHKFVNLPGYYAIFSGKVSSIYDVERYFKSENQE